MLSRHRMATVALLVAGAVVAVIPLFVDGWWIGYPTPDRYALVAVCWIGILTGPLSSLLVC